MEAILRQILEGQTQISKRLDTIEQNMVTKDDIKKVITEQQKDIIALLERTATKESITELSDDIEALNRRIFKQESKIIRLEKIKGKRA
jgi:ubiquinone biosynthesis protein UbiJ